ncbi:MAG: transposase [Rickettsiales bacterium]
MKDVKGANVLADKGYDCDAIVKQSEIQGCKAVIPPKSNRKVKRDVDFRLYKEVHVVECFFGKIKFFRRVFSRFDKNADAYMGFIVLASIVIWLK